MKKLGVIISPNWRDYAEKYLTECIESLRAQSRQADFIYLIDNESSEESFALLKKITPEGKIIRHPHNAGFAEGNNSAMKMAIDDGCDFLISLNMDTVSDKFALEELEQAAIKNPRSGAIQARLMLYQERQKINSLGNATHFLGFGFCNNYKESFVDQVKDYNAIFYPSGAAVLYKTETLKKIGLFDESFWMYAEDQDLGWRIWLSGEECLLASRAVVYHNYEFSRSITKYYWMDRNRFIVILKNLHWLTLVVILPALLLMEVGQLYFAFKTGWLRDKIKVYQYLASPNNLKRILTDRRKIQNLRTTKDSDIKWLFASKIEYQEIESPALKIANIIFSLYWKIIKPIIIW